jgi:5-(carboxyamino)imidazole ribonucleotide synthase
MMDRVTGDGRITMALRVGVVGGGQLARMMIAPAVELGIELRVLAEEDGMSAALAATAVGDYRDADTVLAFARDVDVLTFDHEHVPQEVLAALVDAGVAVRPGPGALRFAQDKLLMRARLQELGMPQPEWAAVTGADDLQRFLDAHDGRAVVKTPRGGYDGKGVRVVSSGAEADDWFAALAEDARGGALLAEELVDFRRELAQQIARRPSGEALAYPVVETVQRDGVCAEVIAPAPHTPGRLSDVAAEIGLGIAKGLDVTGMLAVELFETVDERLLVNELAMRPHNSGHWSQDGAVTSQFEQHLRAVLDLPLGEPRPTAGWAVMVNILGGPAGGTLDGRFSAAMGEHPGAKVHTYGKAPRPGRKVGHVTAVGGDLDEVAYQARAAAAFFLD